MSDCPVYRPKPDPDGPGLVNVYCDIDAPHDGPHHFPSEYDILDSEGKPAPHPECVWTPQKWQRGKKWGIDGMVLVCHVHKRPAPCQGHPEFNYYDYAFDADFPDRAK